MCRVGMSILIRPFRHSDWDPDNDNISPEPFTKEKLIAIRLMGVVPRRSLCKYWEWSLRKVNGLGGCNKGQGVSFGSECCPNSTCEGEPD